MSDFAGRVAIVTGGASGIGRALCLELGRRGARVVVADLDATGAQTVSDEINAAGGQARASALDVSRGEEVQKLVRETADAFGALDLMFNNAGVGVWGEVRELDLAHWRRAIDVNLWGAIHGSLAAYEVMTAQGSGHIVNTASLAGLVSAPTVTPYAAAKHGVVGLSTSLRAEAADLGVRVSVVCPGPIRTGFHDALLRADPEQGPVAPADSIDAGDAAREILRGVERNRRLMVFPSRARRIWAAQRLLPSWIARMNRGTVRRLRAYRAKTGEGGS